MKNLSIWIITLIAVIVFLVGIFYYEILGAVVNATAFIVSLTIIILALILLIIFSHQDHKKKMPSSGKPKMLKFEKEELKTSKKKAKNK